MIFHNLKNELPTYHANLRAEDGAGYNRQQNGLYGGVLPPLGFIILVLMVLFFISLHA
jgi:hypothetical protein